MKANRLDRVNAELQREISTIICMDLRDPQITNIITVSSVDVAPDLSEAKVFLTCYGEMDKNEVLNRIKGAGTFIRTTLAHRIKLRIVPRLNFYLDNSLEYGKKIDDILDKITYTTTPEEGEE